MGRVEHGHDLPDTAAVGLVWPAEAAAGTQLVIEPTSGIPSDDMRFTDSHAEILARILFALRQLDNARDSSAERHLRTLLRDWADEPDRDVDPAALRRLERALRHQPEPDCEVWAELVHAVRLGDTWALTVARYRNGESSQSLARELAISDTTLLAKLNRHGVQIRRQGGATYDAATKTRAVAAYLAGASTREVAAEFGTAKNVIINWVRAAGEQVRTQRAPRRNAAHAKRRSPTTQS